MGLDISYYGGLRPAPEAKLDEDGYTEDWVTFFVVHQSLLDFTEERFPGRISGLVAGAYRPTEKDGFRAGSYSGYNWWRNHLALMAFGRPATDVWNRGMTTGAFVELINFSDAEGLIGPAVARKLAIDFAASQDKATEYAGTMSEDGTWWLQQYSRWRRAFEVAANEGAVEFH